jgi:hypothetical protein
MRQCFKTMIASALLVSPLILSTESLAADVHSGLMERWYSALAAAEREEVAALLASDATMDLQDIGVVQTAAEFVASMDEWGDAIKGGSIRHRIDSDTADAVAVTVCYTFTGSAMMTNESFVFSGRQIASSLQKTVATSCYGF